MTVAIQIKDKSDPEAIVNWWHQSLEKLVTIHRDFQQTVVTAEAVEKLLEECPDRIFTEALSFITGSLSDAQAGNWDVAHTNLHIGLMGLFALAIRIQAARSIESNSQENEDERIN